MARLVLFVPVLGFRFCCLRPQQSGAHAYPSVFANEIRKHGAASAALDAGKGQRQACETIARSVAVVASKFAAFSISAVALAVALGGCAAQPEQAAGPAAAAVATPAASDRAPDVAMPEVRLARSTQSEALVRLGLILIDGRGVERDTGRGVAMLRRAAELGDPDAFFRLGLGSYEGRIMPRDDAEAYRNFRIASEGGSTRAPVYIAFMHANGRHLARSQVEARRWYALGAERGDRESRYWLAFYQLEGRGGELDIGGGLANLQHAVDAKYPAALRYQANLFRDGRFMAQDLPRAAVLYAEAVELGDASAMVSLGLLHRDGRSVEQNDARAVALFRQAAGTGLKNAKLHLAWMYEAGRGVTRDLAEAARLYAEAASD